MKKTLLYCLLPLLILSGCGDISKLKEVKKIAIAGITLNRDFVTVSEDGKEESGFSLLNKSMLKEDKDADTSYDTKLHSIDQELLAYYKKTYGDVKNLIESKGIEVIDGPQFQDNETFKSFRKEDTGIFSTTFNLNGFASAGQKTEDVTKLANELGVDAVGLFTFKLIKIKGSAVLGLMPTETLGLKATLTLIDKNGDKIIGGQYFTVESDEKIEWANMAIGNDLIDISPQNRETFDKLTDKFIAKVGEHLDKGLE